MTSNDCGKDREVLKVEGLYERVNELGPSKVNAQEKVAALPCPSSSYRHVPDND